MIRCSHVMMCGRIPLSGSAFLSPSSTLSILDCRPAGWLAGWRTGWSVGRSVGRSLTHFCSTSHSGLKETLRKFIIPLPWKKNDFLEEKAPKIFDLATDAKVRKKRKLRGRVRWNGNDVATSLSPSYLRGHIWLSSRRPPRR